MGWFSKFKTENQIDKLGEEMFALGERNKQFNEYKKRLFLHFIGKSKLSDAEFKELMSRLKTDVTSQYYLISGSTLEIKQWNKKLSQYSLQSVQILDFKRCIDKAIIYMDELLSIISNEINALQSNDLDKFIIEFRLERDLYKKSRDIINPITAHLEFFTDPETLKSMENERVYVDNSRLDREISILIFIILRVTLIFSSACIIIFIEDKDTRNFWANVASIMLNEETLTNLKDIRAYIRLSIKSSLESVRRLKQNLST